MRHERLIGLDASDKEWMRCSDLAHQLLETKEEHLAHGSPGCLLTAKISSGFAYCAHVPLLFFRLGEHLHHERFAALLQLLLELRREHIGVLPQKAFRRVKHVTRKVVEDENVSVTHAVHLHLRGRKGTKVCVLPVLLADRRIEIQIRSLGHLALRIEHREDACWRLLEQLDDLAVVRVGQHWHLQVLHFVQLNFDLEDTHEEEVVQPLVGIVDAELLEGVGFEDLEPEDVQKADKAMEVLVSRNLDVDFRYDELKEQLVQVLDERVALVSCSVQIERDVVLVVRARRLYYLLDEELLNIADTEQRLCRTQRGLCVRGDNDSVLARHLDIAEVKERGEDRIQLGLLTSIETDAVECVIHDLEISSVVDDINIASAAEVCVMEVLRRLAFE
mmetsp:Transcript_18887/g.38437  ORF Transcript_18887/g.38437 Transcript_18887/m.38437 type:complete len:390 (+) Transcript_18887:2597-3766(+)